MSDAIHPVSFDITAFDRFTASRFVNGLYIGHCNDNDKLYAHHYTVITDSEQKMLAGYRINQVTRTGQWFLETEVKDYFIAANNNGKPEKISDVLFLGEYDLLLGDIKTAEHARKLGVFAAACYEIAPRKMRQNLLRTFHQNDEALIKLLSDSKNDKPINETLKKIYI